MSIQFDAWLLVLISSAISVFIGIFIGWLLFDRVLYRETYRAIKRAHKMISPWYGRQTDNDGVEVAEFKEWKGMRRDFIKWLKTHQPNEESK